MAVVSPLRGLRYNEEKVGPLSHVVAPPYDVIGHEDAERLRARHPNNVIRLILGECPEGACRPDAEYRQAADALTQWTDDGILRRDEEPSVYVCEQEFSVRGTTYTRRGFVARVLLEDLARGSIYPHEETTPGPKADRLQLMRACRANLSHIFALYPGGRDDVAPLLDGMACGAPDAQASDEEGVVSRMWRTSDAGLIDRLSKAMADKPLFIADGHHRYETALAYRDQVAGAAGADHVLMTCVAMDDPGLVILPAHRLVRHSPSAGGDLTEALSAEFDVTPHDGDLTRLMEKLAVLTPRQAFGMIRRGDGPCVVALRSEAVLDEAMPDRSPAWRRLDVSVLQSRILEGLLGLDLARVKEEGVVAYVKSEAEAERRVASGEYEVAFLMNATRIEQVQEIAAAREKMPPKSTYFYPKLLSGLVINPLAD